MFSKAIADIKDPRVLDKLVEAEFIKRSLGYKPYLQQELFHKAGKLSQERLFSGGNRTGKTKPSAEEMKMHLTGIYPHWWDGHVFDKPISAWAVAPTAMMAREVLQKQYYMGDPRKGVHGVIHPSLVVGRPSMHQGIPGLIDTVYIRHSSGGVSDFGFRSSHSGVDAFRGLKKNVIHLDEEHPMDVYLECKMRTAATEKDFKGIVMVSMTPQHGVTELTNYFMQNRTAEVHQDSRWHIMASWEDNPFLSKEEQARLLSGMLPHEVEARSKGIPCIGSGLVYPIALDEIMCDPFEIPDHWPRVFGIDFGWKNPTAALFAAYDRDSDTIYLYAEYYVCQLSPQSHAVELQAMGADWIPGVHDPSGKGAELTDGKDAVSMYRQCGINIISAENSQYKGILTTYQRMKNGKLKFFKTLRHFRGEITMYARDDRGNVKKSNDHLMDAMRYLVMSGIPLATNKHELRQRMNRHYGHYGQAGYVI